MDMKCRTNRLITCVAFFLFVTIAIVPATGVSEDPNVDPVRTRREDQLLPFNEEIQSGRFDNGMEYYLLEHPYPEDTVVLRLIVDAGSVVETESQRGLAHFVEHMAFNGTEAFDEDELVAYLERLGMQFGPDVNAYTSFDETVYKLEIPAGDPEVLETGFEVIAQWAHALSLRDEAIERERGVIVEEWRSGRNAAQRILDQHVPILFADSLYAERLPIGDMEVVRNAPREEFVRFYRRWYRPDNMALIAVGDIDGDRLETLSHRFLSPIPRPEGRLLRPYPFVPEQEGTRVSIATDPEAERSTVSIYILEEPKPFETVSDYRRLLTRSLFASIINERIDDLTRDPEAPMTGGGLGWNRFLRGTEIAVATAVVRGDAVTDALELIARELERAERFGILPSELERAKRRFFQGIDEALVNADTRHASSLADELVRHWTEGEAVPGITEEHRLYRELLPSISVAEVSAVSSEFIREDNRVILAGLRVTDEETLPGGGSVPTEADLRKVIADVEDAEPASWEEVELPDTLLDPDRIEPGTIVASRVFDDVATEEITLANGLRVFLKPTDLREDEILFSASSPGGLALVPDRLVHAADLVPGVVGESGVGEIDAATLEKILSGSSVDFGVRIGRVEEGMRGSTRGEDLELLFQLIHLAFTDPRFDGKQLENIKSATIQSIEGALASPQGRFGRRLGELFANGDPRLHAPEVAEVESVSIDQVEEVYRSRFTDPADFALFFVGSFDSSRIKELAERYLAGIPRPAGAPAIPQAPEEHHHHRPFLEEVTPETAYGTPPPEGIVSETLYAGREPVGQYVGVIHGPYRWSREGNHRFDSVGRLLDIRLRERIREEAGGSYSVGAAGWRQRYPEPWAYMQIGYGMDPARKDELLEIVFEVIDEIRTTPPSSDYLERIRAGQLEEYRQLQQENGYWLSNLEFYLQHRRDLNEIIDYPSLIEALTADDVRRTAERYLDPARRIELTLLPEGGDRDDRD